MPAGTLIAILLLSTPTAVAAKKPHVTSVYTKAYKNCKVIEEQRDPEGVEMWSVSRCRGYAGIPLFLSTDDSRDFLTAGPKFEGSGIDGPLHTIAGPVEWRLVDGKPFAIIFRVTT